MKRKTKRRPVKPVSDPKIMNMHNPKFTGMIEFAWEANGVKYYNFTSNSEMRYGRYVIMQAFLQEYFLRTDLATLKERIKKLKNWLNPTVTKEGAKLELGKCLEMLSIMEEQANLMFEPDTVYRLASCLYFDDKEILSGYDKVYNEKKIQSWREAETIDFFFHKLFQELTSLTVSSREGLISYLKSVPELLKGISTVDEILSR